MCPDKESYAGNTSCIAKGLYAVWAYFCPSKPYLHLSIDGSIIEKRHSHFFELFFEER